MTVVVVCLTSFIGCSQDWLEAKPDSQLVVPESLTDFQGLIDNNNTMGQGYPICNEIASDNHYITDEVFNNQAKTFRIDMYRWTKEERHTDVLDWNNSYKKILIANVILDGLPKISVADNTTQLEWNNIKGQALFHRAYCFFTLLQTYALQYDAATAEKDPGIPLRLSSDINIPTIRNSVKEGYAQVISDLEEATNLLPEKAGLLTRASKAAAYALLARVNLSMGNYQNSLSAATACLSRENALLDLNTIPPTQSFIGRYNVEVLFHCNYTPSPLTAANGLIEPLLYASYAADDLRKTRFFIENGDGTVRFKGRYESVASRFFYGLATDEVYLTRAECLARLGRTEEAIDVLNIFMKSKWDNTVTYPEFTTTNPEEALSMILEERKKELIFRGTRWMDLRRLNKDPRFAITLTRVVNGQTYTLEPNSPKYALPIPDDIVEQTGIVQNPAWSH